MIDDFQSLSHYCVLTQLSAEICEKHFIELRNKYSNLNELPNILREENVSLATIQGNLIQEIISIGEKVLQDVDSEICNCFFLFINIF